MNDRIHPGAGGADCRGGAQISHDRHGPLRQQVGRCGEVATEQVHLVPLGQKSACGVLTEKAGAASHEYDHGQVSLWLAR